MKQSTLIFLAITILSLVLAPIGTAYATKYIFDYSSQTSTIRAPTVALTGGTTGASTISSVAADAAKVNATAGIEFYESANLATSCTTYTADSSTTAPATSGSFSLPSGTTACLWSPAYTIQNSLYAGTTSLNVWVADTTPPAVDASAVTTTKFGLDTSVQGTGSAVASVAATAFLTHYTNELAIAYVAWTDANGRTVSVSGGTGMTWAARGSVEANGNHKVEEFYAVAAAVQSSESITATFSAAISGGVVFTVFSIAGANTASPFDSHTGLPAVATGTTTTPVTTVSTTNLYDLLISGISTASAATAPTCTVDTGFSKAFGTGTACTRAGTSAATYAVGDSQYDYVTAAQSSKSVNETLSASEAWSIVADAIQMSAGVTLTTTHSPDVVLVSISSTTAFTATVTDGSSLSWTNRKSVTNTAEANEWYAISSGTLSSDRIGITFAALGGLFTIVAFGVYGANTASPFDGSTATATGTSTAPSVSLTTTVPEDLVVGMVATGVTDTFTVGSSCVSIQSGSYGATEDKAAATAGSNTCSYTLGTSTTWGMIIDAIQAATTTLTVNEYTTNSGGTHQNTMISSGTTNSITTSKTQVSTSFSSAAGTIPTSGYLELTLTTSSSASVTIYWGTGQLTNLQTVSTYNYVLVISNSVASTWSINLGVARSSTLTRLTNATVWFVSPFSDQIVVTSGSLTTSTGSVVTLPASGTVDIAVAAFSNAVPTSSTSPSTLILSLKILPASSEVYAQYTIILWIG